MLVFGGGGDGHGAQRDENGDEQAGPVHGVPSSRGWTVHCEEPPDEPAAMVSGSRSVPLGPSFSVGVSTTSTIQIAARR